MTEPTEPLIESLARLSVQPGDAVILRTSRVLTMQEADRIRTTWERALKRLGATGIVLHGADFDISVLTKE